ncbi:MAG TPA: metallophosphoesterase [Polyangiaceae bacterium]|nr:metallophosphoesterase [Polyangiaceae bacterium]
MRRVPFLLVAMSIVGAAHLYVWSRLVLAPAWPSPWFELASAFLFLAWASIPFTLMLGRRLAPPWSALVAWPGYAWLGSSFLLLVSVGAVDLVHAVTALASWGFGSASPIAGSELEQARRWATAGALLGGTLVLSALWLGRRVVVRRVPVPLGKLPSGMNGTTIVQLSDVHVGPTIGRRFLERVVEKVNALEPDVVAITGDLVDGSVPTLAPHVAPLGRLRARHGVYFVTGNHEYYSGAEEWCAHLGELGVRVLRNERVSIGTEGESYDLAGVDDFAGRHFGRGHGLDIGRALAGRDESREVVLLAHQPRAVVEAERAGVGLTISGHTHGGQIWPFNYLVRLQQPVTSGLVRFGRSLIYVSNGTGYWGPPMRLGSPAEITQLVLEARPPRPAPGVP